MVDLNDEKVLLLPNTPTPYWEHSFWGQFATFLLVGCFHSYSAVFKEYGQFYLFKTALKSIKIRFLNFYSKNVKNSDPICFTNFSNIWVLEPNMDIWIFLCDDFWRENSNALNRVLLDSSILGLAVMSGVVWHLWDRFYRCDRAAVAIRVFLGKVSRSTLTFLITSEEKSKRAVAILGVGEIQFVEYTRILDSQ